MCENHQVILDNGEYVCSNCGIVIENIDDYLGYTIKDHESNGFHHDGRILDGNTFFLGFTSNYKKYRYFMSDKELKDMKIAHYLEALKYYYPNWVLVDAYRAFIKESKKKKGLNMKKFINKYLESHKLK